MINQLEALSVDMGYSAGILALFYKVAISYGIAPLVIFMGVGAMTDFGPLLAILNNCYLVQLLNSVFSLPYSVR